MRRSTRTARIITTTRNTIIIIIIRRIIATGALCLLTHQHIKLQRTHPNLTIRSSTIQQVARVLTWIRRHQRIRCHRRKRCRTRILPRVTRYFCLQDRWTTCRWAREIPATSQVAFTTRWITGPRHRRDQALFLTRDIEVRFYDQTNLHFSERFQGGRCNELEQ